MGKTLLIVDGHNVVLRAYFGLLKQQLRTKEGIGTWGVYGAFNSIASQIKKYEPTHLLITLDWGRSSKRLAIDPNYKANRIGTQSDSNHEESRQQVKLFIELCDKMNLPLVRFNNVEADDLIAKAAKSFKNNFDSIVIISSDHDIRQLINEKTIVVKPSLGQSKNIEEQIFDREKILEVYGIEPNRLPEIWALTGDSGDNIPGVPGIGEKTAIKLIETHGNLTSLLMSDQKKTAGYSEVIRTAYKLVTLDGLDDIPFPTLDSIKFNPIEYDIEDLKSNKLELFLDKYELNSIKNRWINSTLWAKDPDIGRRIGE